MKSKRHLNILLALIVILEFVLFVWPAKKVAAKEIIINLNSTFEKLPKQKNDIELMGIGPEFCLFNQTKDISSALQKLVAFRSTPIKIKNNSAQPICLQIKGFVNNGEEYNLVNKDELCREGVNLAFGAQRGSLEVAWFKPSEKKWVCNLAEFPGQYPIVPALAGGESGEFCVVGACSEFSEANDFDVAVVLEIEDQTDEIRDISSSIADLACVEEKGTACNETEEPDAGWVDTAGEPAKEKEPEEGIEDIEEPVAEGKSATSAEVGAPEGGTGEEKELTAGLEEEENPRPVGEGEEARQGSEAEVPEILNDAKDAE